MMRTATNLVWKTLILGSALYGTIQLIDYARDTYQNHLGAKSPTPVVDTLDDTAKVVGNGIRRAGDAVSGSVEYCRPYIDGLENRVENGEETNQE